MFQLLRLTVTVLQGYKVSLTGRAYYAWSLGSCIIRRSGINEFSSNDGTRCSSNSRLVEAAPEYYMGMGHTAEQVAVKYGISREEQDAFAVRSHQRAAKALAAGNFADETVSVDVTLRTVGANNKLQEETITFAQDEGVRAETTLDILGKLRPAFNVRGSVTAGNSSQMSDGAASVLLMDREKAVSDGMKPLAKFRSFAVAGVPPEVMGIGPIAAIPKALKLAGLELSDIGLFELNEAFASQSIQVIRELGLDEKSKRKRRCNRTWTSTWLYRSKTNTISYSRNETPQRTIRYRNNVYRRWNGSSRSV